MYSSFLLNYSMLIIRTCHSVVISERSFMDRRLNRLLTKHVTVLTFWLVLPLTWVPPSTFPIGRFVAVVAVVNSEDTLMDLQVHWSFSYSMFVCNNINAKKQSLQLCSSRNLNGVMQYYNESLFNNRIII